MPVWKPDLNLSKNKCKKFLVPLFFVSLHFNWIKF